MKPHIWLKGFKHLLILIFIFTTLLPFLWTAITSFKSNSEILSYPPTIIPEESTFQNYIELFSTTYHFEDYLANSLLLVVFSVTITLIVSMFGGYAASRFKFKGKETIMFLILMGMAIGRFANAMPLYFLANELKLYNTYFILVIAYAAFIAPLVTWLMRAYYNTIPFSIEEAARIDGCSRWGAFWRVIFPIVRPSIIAGGVIAASNAWNEFILTLNLTNTQSMRTLPLALHLLQTDIGVDWGLLSAGAVISILPILIIFLLLQKYFVQGLTAGSISAS